LAPRAGGTRRQRRSKKTNRLLETLDSDGNLRLVAEHSHSARLWRKEETITYSQLRSVQVLTGYHRSVKIARKTDDQMIVPFPLAAAPMSSLNCAKYYQNDW
jgi:hypothetical protein